jgi:hypothetical protein
MKRFLTIVFSLLVALPFSQTANAATSDYQISITRSSDNTHIEAYGQLETTATGSLLGRLCFSEGGSIDSPDRSNLGVVNVKGTIANRTLSVLFEEEGKTTPPLNKIIPRTSVALKKTDTASFGSILPEPKRRWDTDGDAELQISLMRLPQTYKSPKNFRYVSKENGRFDLAKFDKMDVTTAFRFMTTVKWDSLIAPTIVHVVYEPGRRAAVTEFLKQIDPSAQFFWPPVDTCGVKYVEDFVRVTPLLEFYVSRRLQTSGLVFAAYPEELPKTPPFVLLSLRSPSLIAKLKGETLDQATHRFVDFFEQKLKEFLGAKRPKAINQFEIETQSAGVPFAYKARVTGASISECKGDGWEQFEIQVTLNAYEGLAIVLQAPSGFSAPGALTQRPPDGRFKEHVLNDESLAVIQDGFVDFLRRKGIADDGETSTLPAKKIACDL